MTEYIISILIAFITAVIGPVAVEWFRQLIKNRSSKTPIQEALELNEEIDNQLTVILDELDCDRVWVAQFHNGGHFYPTGKSIQKFSIFYEKVASDTTSVQQTFQNIPVSLFPKAFSKVYKETELEISSFQEKNIDGYDLGAFASANSTKSMYLTGLQSLDSHMIGMLCVSYTEKEHKLTEEELNYIRQKAGVIGTLLSEYLKTNVKKSN